MGNNNDPSFAEIFVTACVIKMPVGIQQESHRFICDLIKGGLNLGG